MLNIIGFDFRVMKEKYIFLILKCIEKRDVYSYRQRLVLPIHLFMDGGSMCF
jgi:hypothetical protein